ncbi:MAG: preprotein translocase subunit SecA [SAR202 cluster bacterium]|nr:MAG: preprotein translocase subunit SecA [SAR202 cluster bacterium]|tara:strand:+ start:20210 stop:22795 length:2586 start_codon:yes stop_codon:yes gene_type:complete
MLNILKKLIGNSNDDEIKDLYKIVDRINLLEENYINLSDQDLREQTNKLREKYKTTNSLDSILEEAFALVRETSKRCLGMRHFDVQMIGGICLHQGKIAEMRTGEGKTLIATLAAFLNTLSGNSVHVVTVNDYLAKRDAEWMGKIYKFLGLSVGCIQNSGSLILEKNDDSNDYNLIEVPRPEAYKSDIIYGTNNEFGFDYLRDNMAQEKNEKVQKNLTFAIVDEVDNILIDEARTPLIISGPAPDKTQDYKRFSNIASKLKLEEDYQIDAKRQSIALTEKGIDKVEKQLSVENLYSEENQIYSHLLENSIKAENFYIKNQQYVVRDSEIIIVDEFTGRLMEGRRYSDGLHQALEAKESVSINRESVTYATITLQNYFRLYEKLSGMTGTAATEAEEFKKIYELEVLEIPTNKPSLRDDLADQIYMTEEAKWRAVSNKIKDLNHQGSPVLVGTTTIEKSEYLSKLLKSNGIKCNVLNAKQHESEASIISQAGAPFSVTVSTNMAGRGTDIILGGNPDNYKSENEWKSNHDKVINSGGLYVIGTERHESRRIDNQLRGRSGRQGDPGTTQFYISTEDSLVKRFGGDRIKSAMSAFNWDENEAVENKMISRSIESAQSKVEAYHFEIRKTLVDYDDVMNTQRDVIYKLRDKGLFGDNLDHDIHNYLEEEVESFFENYDELDDQDNINKIFFLRNLFPEEYTSNINLDDLNKESLILDAKKIYETRRENLNEEISKKLDSSIFIHSIDSKWVEHLTVMDNMRQSIGLEAIGQRNPLIQYKKMGFEMFSLLVQNIKSQIVSDSIRVSNIQNKSNQNYKTQKQDFEQTRQNMTTASNSVNQSNNSNLSRQERRRLERLNKKTNKKRK